MANSRGYISTQQTRDVIDELVRQRREAGLKQADMARWLDVSQPTLSALETGRRRPSLDLLLMYAAALGLEVEVRISRRSADATDA